MFRRLTFLMILAGLGVKKKAFSSGFFNNTIQSSQEATPLSLIEIKKWGFGLKAMVTRSLHNSCELVIYSLPFSMKCSEAYKILTKNGWYPISQKGSHVKLKHDIKEGIIIFPNHGSQELGKGLQKKLFKQAGIKP